MTRRKPGRPRLAAEKRQQQAAEARRAVDKELASTPVPLPTLANERVAARLGITTRTLRSRLADAAALPKHSRLDVLNKMRRALVNPTRLDASGRLHPYLVVMQAYLDEVGG